MTTETAPRVNGIHHVTAISGAPQENLDFWSKVLGLRFVKKTVNFDDPGTYHLYYGDETGSPGTIMTFFPWAGAPKGRKGAGETGLTQLAVPAGSLDFWRDRLARAGVAAHAETLFGGARLVAEDPHGTAFALDAVADDWRAPWTGAGIPADMAVRGFAGVTFTLNDGAGMGALLEGLLDYEEIGHDGKVTRYRARGRTAAGLVDVVADESLPAAGMGTGSVHHVAFSVADDATQLAVRETLVAERLNVTPVIDRNYFHSIYFRAPGGVIFEVATDHPGFAVDEPVETLGSALKLPAQHERLRAMLEKTLPPLAA